jgi:predicted transcriptional regulator
MCGRIEDGKVEPGWSAVRSIAKALDISLAKPSAKVEAEPAE